ncbi:MAG: ABC transporter ATP-binding protein [Cyanobacteria bacterium P01_F01_bin.42]
MDRSPLLELKHLSVRYGGIQALQDVNLVIYPEEIVTLVGANGAGKSTILRAISRLVEDEDGQIFYLTRAINSLRPHQVVKLGIAHSPEGRQILTQQTVEDNLMLGAYTRRDRLGIKSDLEAQWDNFPRLLERKHQIAGTLSGGEQQMLAIARALMSRPQLLLLDEPSLGLAPAIVREIFVIIQRLRSHGVTILLVEQNANLALQCADRGYILEAGQVKLTGQAADLLGDERVKQAYLG